MSCAQLNSKNNGLEKNKKINNGLGLLFKTTLWRLFCLLSFVVTDGKDGNGLKLEKGKPSFSSLDAISTKKIPKKLLLVAFFKTFH